MVEKRCLGRECEGGVKSTGGSNVMAFLERVGLVMGTGSVLRFAYPLGIYYHSDRWRA